MAAWKTDGHLERHFGLHSRELRIRSIEAYDASAQETLGIGTYFEFFHEDADEWRTGCYHPESGRLTVLDLDERIVTHFRCTVQYVMDLPDSNYE